MKKEESEFKNKKSEESEKTEKLSQEEINGTKKQKKSFKDRFM